MRGTFVRNRCVVHAAMRDASTSTLCGKPIGANWLRTRYFRSVACRTCERILGQRRRAKQQENAA